MQSYLVCGIYWEIGEKNPLVCCFLIFCKLKYFQIKMSKYIVRLYDIHTRFLFVRYS